MRRNRFERVQAIQDDAITLELAPAGDPEMARVHVPSALGGTTEASAERSPKTSDVLPKVDAFRGAVQLANTMKAPIVVLDAHDAWLETWGDLYTPV